MSSDSSDFRVVVTGISGLLGQSLFRLLNEDARVKTIIGIDIQEPSLRSEKLQFHREDITSSHLENIFKQAQPTHVIHLAFVVKPVRDSEWAHGIDVGGTRNVLTAAAGASPKSIVVASSSVVYGARPRSGIALDEDTPLQPDPGHSYSADKCEVEKICDIFRRDHSEIAISTVRVVTILGPRMSNFITRALEKRVQFLPWKLDPPWQFIHADDAALAFRELAFAQCRGAFNLAADGTIRLVEIAQTLGHSVVRLPRSLLYFIAELGWRFHLTSLSEVPGVLTLYFCYPPFLDTRKIKKEIHVSFKYTSRQAIEETISLR